MNVLYFMIPISLLLGGCFLAFFIWATKNGQYDDLETPAMRILFKDKKLNNNTNSGKSKKDDV